MILNIDVGLIADSLSILVSVITLGEQWLPGGIQKRAKRMMPTKYQKRVNKKRLMFLLKLQQAFSLVQCYPG